MKIEVSLDLNPELLLEEARQKLSNLSPRKIKMWLGEFEFEKNWTSEFSAPAIIQINDKHFSICEKVIFILGWTGKVKGIKLKFKEKATPTSILTSQDLRLRELGKIFHENQDSLLSIKTSYKKDEFIYSISKFQKEIKKQFPEIKIDIKTRKFICDLNNIYIHFQGDYKIWKITNLCNIIKKITSYFSDKNPIPIQILFLDSSSPTLEKGKKFEVKYEFTDSYSNINFGEKSKIFEKLKISLDDSTRIIREKNKEKLSIEKDIEKIYLEVKDLLRYLDNKAEDFIKFDIRAYAKKKNTRIHYTINGKTQYESITSVSIPTLRKKLQKIIKKMENQMIKAG